MLLPEHKVTISNKHQPYLKILNTNINDGETVAWSVIKTAFKKRALVVHPDKGGSKEAFDELKTTFQKLEHLIEHGTEFEFDGFAEMSSSLDEILNELKAHFARMNDSLDRMNASLDKMSASLECSFNKLNASLEKLHATASELHTSLQALDANLTELNAKVESIVANISFYVGCYSVFLGSMISILSKNHQPQNTRSVGAFVFGAGLTVIGGYLVANSLFKKEPPTPTSENKEQSTELVVTRAEPKYMSAL